MWRWLRDRRYWIAYYAAYPISVTVLAVVTGPASVSEWADIVTVSAGIALGFAVAVEVIGRLVLLIPGTIRKIHSEGVEEGIQKGVEETNAAWKAWLARKAAAEAAGLPFDEPSPADKDSAGS